MAAVKEREENLDRDSQFVIVDYWLRTLREQPDRLQPRNVYAQATNNVGAGAYTVNAALQSFFYHLLRNPETLRKAREEVDDAVKNGRCTSKVVSFSDAQQLHYIQACIKEALRFFTPVPMGLPRSVPAGGLTIGDRTFTEGTILSVNPWVVHRSTELWGSDARLFVPERWFRDDAAELERKYFIPFGAGYNSCPGHYIAKMELSKITATILRDYDLHLVDETRKWKWRAYFTVVPKGWPVYVNQRGNETKI
ncbi:hypothetical protein Daus18300_006036 [Diaporthe australafricana]|uniref:Cytochrome P450 n=1 Tax=Diaporthe australafricana TaxID=127596 RepID=A0ABR3WWK0_9PEZI